MAAPPDPSLRDFLFPAAPLHQISSVSCRAPSLLQSSPWSPLSLPLVVELAPAFSARSSSSSMAPSPFHSLSLCLTPSPSSPLPSAMVPSHRRPYFPWRHFLLPGGRRPPQPLLYWWSS
uniref:Uncharacterized protein n=1 Tax=Zea mays TaxID=4577 RepID=A0A804NS50_MAIZE